MRHRFLGIDLSDGIRPRHVLAYFLIALISSAYAGAMATLQPGLLTVIGIPPGDQGIATGMLSALQEVVLILVLGPLGALADRMGRRPIYVFGLLATAAGFALYPFATNLLQLAGARLIVALGGAAMIGMMVTVIADYTTDTTRGHANGVQGFVATLGAFVPPFLAILPKMFVTDGMSELLAQRATFAVAGSLGLFGALIAVIGLAPHGKTMASQARTSLLSILRDGASAAKERGTALSYAAAFISRGDLAVTGAFVFLWLIQVGIASGLTPSAAMQSVAAPRVFMVVIGAMIGSLVMGFVADRIRRVTAVAIAAGVASLAYLGMGLVKDPTAPWVYGLLLVMGIAEISAFVSSQALVGQRAPAKIRGAVMGLFGVAGAVGILIATLGGGFLYSKVAPSAPFLVFGVLNLLVVGLALKVRQEEAGSPEPTARLE